LQLLLLLRLLLLPLLFLLLQSYSRLLLLLFLQDVPGTVPVSSPLDRPVTVQVVVAGSFPQIPTSASFSNFFFFPAPFPLLAD
jgi:hypothetical protein